MVKIFAAQAPIHPAWVSGLYYGTDANGAFTRGVGALNSANLHACPVIVPNAVSVTKIGAEITTISGGNNFRCGLYRDSAGYPGPLIVDSGDLSAGSTAWVEATIAAAIGPGLVWFVCFPQDATMQFRVLSSGGRPGWLGSSAGGGATGFGCIIKAQAYGALPNPFPSAGTRNSAHPLVMVLTA